MPSPDRRLRLCEGILVDVRRRLPYYTDDWVVGLRGKGAKKALAATVYIFFTNMMPAITFAFFLADRTHDTLGVVEVILSMAIGNGLFALLAGQPLVVVGVTGPVSIFCATLYDLAVRFGIPPLGWLFYTCAWSCALHVLLAAFNANRAFPAYTTAFAEDVFGFLICSIYVYEGAAELVRLFTPRLPVSHSLLGLLLGLGTLWLAATLSGARGWTVLPRGLRALVADYGASAAILIMTACRWLPAVADLDLPSLRLPAAFAPSTPRPWVPVDDIAAVGAPAAFAALLPAVVLTALLYFDHNISSMLSQRPEYGLKKPSSFDLDFLLLGLSVLVSGVLGLPPNYGLIPQAPLHVRSLAKIKEVKRGPLKEEVWVSVVETRVSALGQSLLTFGLLSGPLLRALSTIPKGVLAGLFLYLGSAGFAGNGLARRLHFLAMDAASRLSVEAAWARVGLSAVVMFSLLRASREREDGGELLRSR